jgi:Ca2+-binding EF-hand superfamily protein
MSDAQEISEAFTFADKDKDGSISLNEFKTAVRSLGYVLTDDEIDSLADSNKKFNQDQFSAAIGKTSSSSLITNIKESDYVNALAQFDKEKKNNLPSLEMKGILTTLGDKFSDAECDRIFAAVNIKDGLVKYDDVVKRLIKGDISA